MTTQPLSEPALSTTQAPPLEIISGRAVLERHLDALTRADPRLLPVLEAAGEVPLRREAGGFAGLARIVCAQLLSVTAAAAIHARVVILLGEVDAGTLLAYPEADLRTAGLSRAKVATLRAIAEAEQAGLLDYARLPTLSADVAIAELMRIKGIGRWTAEIYLLFCIGHPDIFPAGDLALRKAAATALARDTVPSENELRELAGPWSPWRGAAARLLWRHYAQTRARPGTPV